MTLLEQQKAALEEIEMIVGSLDNAQYILLMDKIDSLILRTRLETLQEVEARIAALPQALGMDMFEGTDIDAVFTSLRAESNKE